MLRDNWTTIMEAVGDRRYMLVPLTIGAIGAATSALAYFGGTATGADAVLPVIAAVAIALLLVSWWLLGYATKARLDAEPKLHIEFGESYPFVDEIGDPHGRHYECYSMRVTNLGSQQLNSCKAEVARAVRDDGKGVVNIPFSLMGTHFKDEIFSLRPGQEVFVRVAAVPVGFHFEGRAGKFAQWGQSWPHVTDGVGEAFLPQEPTNITVQVLSEAPPAKLSLRFAPDSDGAYRLRLAFKLPFRLRDRHLST